MLTSEWKVRAEVAMNETSVFATAVFTGRVVRYSALGYLGYRFGDQAAQAVRTYYPQVLLVAAGLLLLGLLGRTIMAHRSAG
jgi:membrane protein DedA with SNARE-associated domain